MNVGALATRRPQLRIGRSRSRRIVKGAIERCEDHFVPAFGGQAQRRNHGFLAGNADEAEGVFFLAPLTEAALFFNGGKVSLSP